ncbi:TonB-dependent siderophore receptor [Thauera sinica]|nr:TonB-dependent siderophore receptor [Thauera sp. K11]
MPCLLGAAINAAWAQDSSPAGNTEGVVTLKEVKVIAAGEQIKQAPGVSTITAEQIERTPVTNDVSEIVRRQPGVNLTGNTSTGARGNNRQIDIRGMGPENTLILIDGKPVLSRNSVRYGVGGERDTRGDSNWVPAEAIESIEVLRGPAAARYGSGAAGGVVNIRTKAPTERTFNLNLYTNIPEDADEGDTQRVNVLAAGPINEALSYRLYGNYSVTDNDKSSVNPDPAFDGRAFSSYAGREGVKNRDLSGRLSWRLNAEHRIDFDASWSRQGNKFAGDSLHSYIFADTDDPSRIDNDYSALIGKETNRLTRKAASITHFGRYAFGTSESYLQYERTDNRRLGEGLGGAVEGTIQTGADRHWNETRLNNFNAKSEFHIPLRLGLDQVLTAGAEFRRESMDDPGSIAMDLPAGTHFGGIPVNAAERSTHAKARLFGVYVEDNLYVGDRLILTPGLRFDHHSEFGDNTSPSLNAAYQIDRQLTLKGGIARAYKAPNLYQLNPNYVYNSRGNGCWAMVGPCYILGNPDLDPEISINKEIGLAFRNDTGWAAGLTYVSAPRTPSLCSPG